MLRRLRREACELCRTQPVRRTTHAIHNSLHHETVIVGVWRPRGWRRAGGAARGVGMHGRDQDVGRWDADLLFDQAPHLDAHIHLGAQQVEDHQGELRLSVIEHEALCSVQMLQAMGRRDRLAEPRLLLGPRRSDDTDLPRRVNHALLKQVKNDIEICRRRDLIDTTGNYQRCMAPGNRLKDKHSASAVMAEVAAQSTLIQELS